MTYPSRFFFILLVCLAVGSKAVTQEIKQPSGLKFLYKTELDTSKEFYGYHIEIRQILPETDELIPLTIDDRLIIERSGYSKQEKITILGEFLTFRVDTSKSNKRYQFKAAYFMTPPEGLDGFTVEIEALYSFTRMLMIGYPPIKPMLVNRVTGEELNTNLKAVSEVYDIYTKWYIQNKECGFEKITLPLAGTPYAWLGEDKLHALFLRKSL